MAPIKARRLEALEKNIDTFFLLLAILSGCFTARELARTDDFDGLIAELSWMAAAFFFFAAVFSALFTLREFARIDDEMDGQIAELSWMADAYFLLAAVLSTLFTLREFARKDDELDGQIAELTWMAKLTGYLLFTLFEMFLLAMMFSFPDLYSVSPIIGLLCLAAAIVQTLRSIRNRRITMRWLMVPWLFVYPLLFLITRLGLEVNVASLRASVIQKLLLQMAFPTLVLGRI